MQKDLAFSLQAVLPERRNSFKLLLIIAITILALILADRQTDGRKARRAGGLAAGSATGLARLSSHLLTCRIKPPLPSRLLLYSNLFLSALCTVSTVSMQKVSLIREKKEI